MLRNAALGRGGCAVWTGWFGAGGISRRGPRAAGPNRRPPEPPLKKLTLTFLGVPKKRRHMFQPVRSPIAPTKRGKLALVIRTMFSPKTLHRSSRGAAAKLAAVYLPLSKGTPKSSALEYHPPPLLCRRLQQAPPVGVFFEGAVLLKRRGGLC